MKSAQLRQKRLFAEASRLYSSGASEEALFRFQEALEIAVLVGDRRSEGALLNWTALSLRRLGRPREALNLLLRALPILQGERDREGEGAVLNSIGEVYRSLGRIQEALDHYQEALVIARGLLNPVPQGTVLNNMGLIFRATGRLEAAKMHYEKAFALARKGHNYDGEVTTLNNLGRVNDDLGRFPDALNCFHAALNLARRIGNRPQEATALTSLGDMARLLGLPSDALKHYDEALGLFRIVGDRRGEGRALSSLGSLLRELGSLEQARSHLEDAVALDRILDDRQGLAVSLTNLGAILRDMGESTKAADLLDEAMTLVEGTRQELLSEEIRSDYFAAVDVLYESLTSLLLDEGADARALEVVERGRARGFLDLLAEAGADIRQGIDPALREEEERCLAELAELRRRLGELRSALGGKQPSRAIADLEKRESELEFDLFRIEGRIRKTSPRYAALIRPTIWGLEEIQGELLDERTALLEYVLAEGASLLFCVLEDDFEVFTLPPKEEIETKVRELRAAVLHGLPRYPHGHELYQDLIAPAGNLIRGKELLICADGALHYLPFSLLLTASPEEGEGGSEGEPPGGRLRAVAGDEEEQALLQKVEADLSSLPAFDYKRLPYLIREHAISYAPSATVAGMVRAEARGVRRYDAELAAFADPRGLGAEEQEEDEEARAEELPVELGAALAHTRDTLEPIPATADEVWALAELLASGALPQEHPERFDEGPIVLRTAAAATKEEVERLTSGERAFRFLHVATHGLLDPEKPQFSGLVFTPRDGKDPFWRTFEIFNARIPSELVVLSACETGLGRIVSGEGIVGLTRAFLYAGAPSVCVSLWKVAEESSPQLMKSFYRRILAGESKAKALQGAQLELLEESPYAHPFWWAPFVLVGER